MAEVDPRPREQPNVAPGSRCMRNASSSSVMCISTRLRLRDVSYRCFALVRLLSAQPKARRQVPTKVSLVQ
jgi:hypothetical protein